MKRFADPLLVIVYVALAALPLLATIIGIRGRAVEGSLPPAPAPEVSFARFLDESVQHGVTSWFESNLGLKGTSIGFDNALLYHAFTETKPGSTVRVGKDGVLFSHEDIDFFNKHAPWITEPAYVEQLADQIADAQRRLAADHRALVPVIIPAKTSIYRDKVPASWIMDVGTPRPSEDTTRMIRSALDRRGVIYVDARDMFETSMIPRYELYGVDSRHWSRYGACLALREVATAYAKLTGKPRPAHECLYERRRLVRSHVDIDLLRLINAYGVYADTKRVPHAGHAPPPAGAPKPSVLFVGTSFSWTLMYDADASGLYGPLHVSYYHQKLVSWPENVTETLKTGTPMWRDAMVGKDLYVLDLFESYLGVRGGYAELFLNDFAGDSSTE